MVQRTKIVWGIKEQERLKYDAEATEAVQAEEQHLDKEDRTRVYYVDSMVKALPKYLRPVERKVEGKVMVDDDGQPVMGRPTKICTDVVIESSVGTTLLLRKSAKRNGGYSIIHPSKMEKPTLRVGSGNKVRYIPDMLANDVEVKGETERFALEREFKERISRFICNDELVNEIITLLNS